MCVCVCNMCMCVCKVMMKNVFCVRFVGETTKHISYYRDTMRALEYYSLLPILMQHEN